MRLRLVTLLLLPFVVLSSSSINGDHRHHHYHHRAEITGGTTVVAEKLITPRKLGKVVDVESESESESALASAAMLKGCDIYQGRWVLGREDESYPLYDHRECPFILNQFACQSNGRPDHLYLHFKWQPHRCNLPRFNGAEFLWRSRGKRIMFVGDSLSLNQWQSLACMLHISSPHARYTISRFGDASEFHFPDYNFSLMLSRNALLVDIVRDRNNLRILKLDSVESGSEMWKGVDVLIFDSWHWWHHTGRQQPWDLIQVGRRVRSDMNRLTAYEIALMTWAKWIDNSIDPTKTIVFFQGVSPDHTNGTEWVQPNTDCVAQTSPVFGSIYPGGPHPAEVVLERVLATMSRKQVVHLLNVTELSQMRKDGHPSVYGFGGHFIPDCSHWCLPGVPDTWNHLLYAELGRIIMSS